MYRIEKMKPEHLKSVLAENINEGVRWQFADRVVYGLSKQPYSGSIFIGDELMGCGGISEIWNNRGYMWMVFSEKSKKNFLAVFRAIKFFIDHQPLRRVEIAVPVRMKKAQKRAEMWGFKLECDCAKAYLADGEDCKLYSIVRDV